MWGPFLRCPLKHRDPTTVPCPPPAPWPSPTCAFLNRVRKHREGKSVESLFDTDLLTRRLNRGSLARNPFEVLWAGTRGKLWPASCSVTGVGCGWGTNHGATGPTKQKSQAKPETSRQKKGHQPRNERPWRFTTHKRPHPPPPLPPPPTRFSGGPGLTLPLLCRRPCFRPHGLH